jgi:hypothetical protein
MAITVFPTKADVGGNGKGSVLSEEYFSKFWDKMLGTSMVSADTGLALVLSGLNWVHFAPGLNYHIAAGVAYVRGHLIIIDTPTIVSSTTPGGVPPMSLTSDKYIWLDVFGSHTAGVSSNDTGWKTGGAANYGWKLTDAKVTVTTSSGRTALPSGGTTCVRLWWIHMLNGAISSAQDFRPHGRTNKVTTPVW